MINSEYNVPKDYTSFKVLETNRSKALFCGADCHIFLETSTPFYREICDFLVAIAEPVHRTRNIHEYILTKYSLYAAASMGIKTSDIELILRNLSKNELPKELIENIKKNTETFGKTRLILKDKRYFIVCSDERIKKEILKIPSIYRSYQNILRKKKEISKIKNENLLIIKTNEEDNIIKETAAKVIFNIMNDSKNMKEILYENYFEVDPEEIEIIKKDCEKTNFPLLEEYYFKNDKDLPTLEINPHFKQPTRGYQQKALNIMFNNERARSGIIVLPCGSGKTLVGILATCTIKKNTIILCNTGISVKQWYNEFENWSKLEKNNIARITSRKKDPLWEMDKEGGILITVYSMISYVGKRNPETQKIMDKIKNTEWGLMILDEVQVAPAEAFRKTLSIIKSHCKLGLTATLVREDDGIKDLHFLIGPKHYEANWLDLQRDGYLARVKCIQILCEMETKFYHEYLKNSDNSAKRRILYNLNPNKLFICKKLVEKYKNDKVIIFSDYIFMIDKYQEILRCPCIKGNTNENERNLILNKFRNDPNLNLLLMSKVGDTSIDIPNAKVIIQVSSHFGSRRQEAQRLGRILRPKKDKISEYNAFFYTIVTKNTEEMFFSNKRQKFLVDQGYYFIVRDAKEELAVNELEVNQDYSQKVLEELKRFDPDKEEFQYENFDDDDYDELFN